MRKLSSLILFLVISVSMYAQKSPHGDDFVVSCEDCHKTDGWKVDLKTVAFNHESTKFPLIGQHQAVNCKQCHTSLEFAKTQTECNSCHTDIHQQTVGPDCARCHTSNSWVVPNITQLHQQSRFPLIGAHATADCYGCHTNSIPSAAGTASPTASLLRFDALGIACYDCHETNYNTATSPNHAQNNYSKNCTDCHSMNAFSWTGASINHNFFPLTDGHALNDCSKCHSSGTFSNLSPDCISCHQSNYSATSNPGHTSLGFSTNCKSCHTLSPGWKPAEYRDHDTKSFPIYSGKHNGQWNACADCHTNAGNYAQFTCIGCHEHNKADTDGKHDGVNGYAYTDDACFACHPTGSKDGSFDHNTSGFPLTGAHTTTACESCHTNGYAGTSNICASCHTNNYTQTTNPNHVAIGIANDCATCHTTNPGWNPATFPTHNNYYVITGAHTAIANDCSTCHQGNYVNSPKTCFGCHEANFNQTTNPNHATSQYSTTCENCHSQSAWVPSTFDHNITYPLTGAHATIANDCNQCHANGYSNTPNTCAGCHQNNFNQAVNPNHTTLGIPNDCANCHTTTPGWQPATFPIHNNYYVIAGAHISIANDCATCHQGNYVNSPNTCFACHTADYNQTTNPNHVTSQFATTCETCHSQSAWVPSTFDHNLTYPLTGAHATIASNCVQCHSNGYANTPNTCVGCHQTNFNQTTNPNHNTLGLSTNCAGCHTTNPGWEPATFPVHNNYYVLAGAHVSKPCADCHNGNYNNTPNTCAGCHTTNYNQTTNPNHAAAYFPTTCADCHTQTAWTPATFDHDGQYFPIYSGKHNGEWNTCADCHTNPSNYAIFTCTTSCHPQSSTNNDHDGVSNYVYNSAACYNCHPDGNSDGKKVGNNIFKSN